MSERRVSVGKLIFGVTILFAGVALALDNLGLARADDLLLWWPVAVVAFGLLRLAGPTRPEKIVGLFAAVIGAWILAWNLDWVRVGPWEFVLPACLLLVGALLLAGGLRRREADDGSTVSGFALLSGVDRKSTSAAFRGGEVTAVLGGIEVDLTGAHLAPGGAELQATAVWGGVDIRVPQDWAIESRVMPLLGVFQDGTAQRVAGPTAAGPRLVIRGNAIMGGIEISNGGDGRKPREEDEG